MLRRQFTGDEGWAIRRDYVFGDRATHDFVLYSETTDRFLEWCENDRRDWARWGVTVVYTTVAISRAAFLAHNRNNCADVTCPTAADVDAALRALLAVRR